MILDFNAAELLRVSAVSRWGIVEMNRPQNVAEHSYNVATIALNIYANSAIWDNSNRQRDMSQLAVAALLHDASEVYSGDIPSSEKKEFAEALEQWETERFPLLARHSREMTAGAPYLRLILKAADLIEAIAYCRRYCIDARKAEIMRGLEHDLEETLEHKIEGVRSEHRKAICGAALLVVAEIGGGECTCLN